MQRSPKRRHATSKIAEAATFVSTLIGVFKPNKISALAITAFRGDSSHALKKKDHSCTISKQQIIPHTLSSESDEEIESDDIDCEEDDDMEIYKMRANSVIVIIQKDNIIASFSPPKSLELFYLCKVIEVGVATKRIVDKHNHSIKSGSYYIK